MSLADQRAGDDEEVIFPLQKLRDPARASCAAMYGHAGPTHRLREPID